MAIESAGQLPIDRSWFLHVNSFARDTPWLHTPAADFARYGVVLFALLLLGAWWVARSRRDTAAVAAALWAPLGTLLAVGVNQLVGSRVDEARPYATLPHVLVLVSRTSDFSFPSDHAVMSGAVAAGVLLVDRRLGLVAAAAAAVMCLDRVYVGAHYPGDVLAGLLLGAAVLVAGWLVVRPVLLRAVDALAGTRLGVLVTTPESTADPRTPGADAA